MQVHAKPVIGLLGAPGSGKSLVARQMGELGAGVIDADAIAHDVLDEPEVRDQLIEWWGDRVLDEDGDIHRAAVGRIVFNDPAELDRLESVVHPRVTADRARQRARYRTDPAVRWIVEDVPLLLENGLDAECDVLVFVDAPWDVRLERVSRTRGWDAEQLRAREKNQAPLDIKRDRADYVVQNDSGEAECFDQVRRVLSEISPEPA